MKTLALIPLAVAALAAPASAAPGQYMLSPNRHAQCSIVPHRADRSAPYVDCDLDKGRTQEFVRLYPNGRVAVRMLCRGCGALSIRDLSLIHHTATSPYGSRIAGLGFTVTSTRAGLRVVLARTGRGFLVGPNGKISRKDES